MDKIENPQADCFLGALADQMKKDGREVVAESLMKRAVELTALREALGKLSTELGRRINVDAYKQVGKLVEEILKACPAARTSLEELWGIFRTQSTDLCLAAVRIQQLTEQLASREKALAESHAREMAADPIETSYTRAELAAAVDAAHAFMHEGRTDEAHEALHAVGAGKERVGSATRDPEAQRVAGELMAKLEGTGLPCGHKLADLIGGQGARLRATRVQLLTDDALRRVLAEKEARILSLEAALDLSREQYQMADQERRRLQERLVADAVP